MSTTELWWRNPHNYIKELAEVQHARNVIWDRGMLMKRAIDPVVHARLWFAGEPFRLLVCGEQGTAELDMTHTMDNPLAVYPTWVYGVDDFTDLEEMVTNPVGEDARVCNSVGVPPDELPVYGQEHRVILAGMPGSHTGAAKHLFQNIMDLVNEYEGTVKLHLHNSYSFAAMFARGFASADYEPRSNAAHGKLHLPNGKMIKVEQAQRAAHWIAQLNMAPGEMTDPRMRCIFNIKSAMWAADNYERDLKFTKKGDVNLDPRAKQIQSHPGARTVLNGAKAQAGDKVTCNSCSLQNDCQYFRADAVCSLPDSETSALANYLNSRNADRLVDAMGTMLSAQAKRLERAVKEEEDYGEYSPEVTKMLNNLFANTLKLAKVIDPNLTKPQVQITLGAGVAGSITADSPQQLVARAMRALEDQGIAREDIKSDMVQAMVMKMMGQEQAALQGQVNVS